MIRNIIDLPYDPVEQAACVLPGIGPVGDEGWLWRTPDYEAQMAERRARLDQQETDVLAVLPEGVAAAQELFEVVIDGLRGADGFQVGDDDVLCPDGVRVPLGDPLGTIGRLVQADMCVLQRPDGSDEHLLVAAVVCFPANWRLEDKIGRPLTAIHDPVPEYAGEIAKRVQRLFDGVQVGRPLWRVNGLSYHEPHLFQPSGKLISDAPAPYFRSERQVVMRLPKTRAVVFLIHSFVFNQEIS
ncbi:MAG: DUF3445 domain-containing protein [Paracoccaceae bacterium]|jgi:dimethylamine monooxygenase subunit A|nr:DUF3445 domain-containing protein [Paracoccaceae bacterium]